MTSQKYLNGVLTLIAFCLVVITLSVVGVFPKANAASIPQSNVQKVDIVSVAGQTIPESRDQNFKRLSGSLPIRNK